jgi:hypothetical protein
MDLLTMLSELRSERAQIDEAILVLERLASGRVKRRGRPPSWLKPPAEEAGNPKDEAPAKKRTLSPEARARMAAAQRRRWAAMRAEAAEQQQ